MAASHAAVQSVLRKRGWSSDHRKATGHAEYQSERGIPEIADEPLSKLLLFMDAPDHTRLRGLISKAFTRPILARRAHCRSATSPRLPRRR